MSDSGKRVALVIGAGNVWGRTIAVAFARLGTIVAVNDLSPAPLEQTALAIQAVGGQWNTFLYDTAKKMPVQALIGEVVEKYGRLDVLINAALTTPAAGILEMDEWDWHRTVDMNLGGPFFAIQVAGRVMREQGGGSIVNILIDPIPVSRSPGRAALAASQSALEALTRTAAVELGVYRVRVNAIVLKIGAGEPPRSSAPGRMTFIPVEISTLPEWVADQALYLCSPEAEDLNGRVISG